jgi:quercetin dioxygenase-like cupin family protein
MYHVNVHDLPGNEVSRTFEGGKHGPCSVSFFLVHNQPGQGPRLHHHHYDETFLILGGRVRVTVGQETIEGGPGDIVIGPAEAPHGFTNLGPGPARMYPRSTSDEDRVARLSRADDLRRLALSSGAAEA